MQRLEVSGVVRLIYWSLGVKGLKATFHNPFPYNVTLQKAVQWAWYNSLWFWIRWYICWSDILL